MRIRTIVAVAVCTVATAALAADRIVITADPVWLQADFCSFAPSDEWGCAGEAAAKQILRDNNGFVEVDL